MDGMALDLIITKSGYMQMPGAIMQAEKKLIEVHPAKKIWNLRPTSLFRPTRLLANY